MALVQLTQVSAEPVSVTELRDWARLATDDDSESFVADLIRRAREYVEQVTGRQLGRATFRETFDEFPEVIRLSRPPLVSVSSITYTDVDGEEQTLDSDSYLVDSDSEPGRVVPAYGEVWPTPQCQVNAVKVAFTAGYEASSIPKGLKQAIMTLAKWWYDGNEAVSVPHNLLRHLRLYRHGDMQVA